MVYDALNDVHFTDITYHDETYAETSLILDDVIDSKGMFKVYIIN